MIGGNGGGGQERIAVVGLTTEYPNLTRKNGIKGWELYKRSDPGRKTGTVSV